MSCYFVKLVIPYRNEVCAILLHISIIILAYYGDGEVEGKRKLFCANIRNESSAGTRSILLSSNARIY